ncbi:MAG: hypothetical protein G01um101456_224 [Parcubacteria group bacterium Gr01-1014_56]|nr:MAG: hypothetical protein G01um101456_224 [Parcubacteria group bacterium Gr01-1014_56]
MVVVYGTAAGFLQYAHHHIALGAEGEAAVDVHTHKKPEAYNQRENSNNDEYLDERESSTGVKDVE